MHCRQSSVKQSINVHLTRLDFGLGGILEGKDCCGAEGDGVTMR